MGCPIKSSLLNRWRWLWGFLKRQLSQAKFWVKSCVSTNFQRLNSLAAKWAACQCLINKPISSWWKGCSREALSSIRSLSWAVWYLSLQNTSLSSLIWISNPIFFATSVHQASEENRDLNSQRMNCLESLCDSRVHRGSDSFPVGSSAWILWSRGIKRRKIHAFGSLFYFTVNCVSSSR